MLITGPAVAHGDFRHFEPGMSIMNDRSRSKRFRDNIGENLMKTEVTEDTYDEMLGVLPPAYYVHNGFLVGEAYTHRTCAITGNFCPSFAAYIQENGKFYALGNLTIAEFKQATRHPERS